MLKYLNQCDDACCGLATYRLIYNILLYNNEAHIIVFIAKTIFCSASNKLNYDIAGFIMVNYHEFNYVCSNIHSCYFIGQNVYSYNHFNDGLVNIKIELKMVGLNVPFKTCLFDDFGAILC